MAVRTHNGRTRAREQSPTEDRLDQRAYMVKQYVAVVRSRSGLRFRVFETGDPKYYLFDPLDRYDCSCCNAFPVLKADLRPEIRRALRHGWGNSL